MIRKTLALPKWLWEAVADYRYAARISSEAEAVRRLLQQATESAPGFAGRRRGPAAQESRE
jgi:hypothetical protein